MPYPALTPMLRPKTVRDVLALYEQYGEPQKGSVAGSSERKRVRAIFAAAHGDLPLADCDGLILVAWIDSVPTWAAANTKSRIIRTIKRPFAWCARLGRIERNPFAGVSPPRGDEGRDMTPAEFQAAMRVATPVFRRVLLALWLSGMRPVEFRRCRWTHLRPELAAIVQQEHKTSHITKRPRRIPLPRQLHNLCEWVRRHQEPPSEHVFLNSRGQPWTARALDKQWAKIRRLAGIAADCRLYSARHAYGTGAILNGCDLMTTAELMGHDTPNTTRRYLHLADKLQHMRSAQERAVIRRKP